MSVVFAICTLVKSDETSKLAIVSVNLAWTGRSFCWKWTEILMWFLNVFPIAGVIFQLRYRARLKVGKFLKSTIIRKGTSGLCILGSPYILGQTVLFGLIRNYVGKLHITVRTLPISWKKTTVSPSQNDGPNDQQWRLVTVHQCSNQKSIRNPHGTLDEWYLSPQSHNAQCNTSNPLAWKQQSLDFRDRLLQ